MTDLDEFIFCRWQGRLWPARILSESGISPSKTFETDSDCLDVQLICLDKHLRVKCTDTRPFEQKQAESISCGLVHKEDFTHEEAVEELTYRKALRIALDILASHDCHTTQMTIEEPVMAQTQVLASEELKKNTCVRNSNGTKSTLKQNGAHLPQGRESICTRQSSRKASCIKKTEAEQGKKLTRSCALTQTLTKMKKQNEKEEESSVRKGRRTRKILYHPQMDTSNERNLSHTQCEQPLHLMKLTPAETRGRWDEERERLQEVGKSSVQTCSAISGEEKDQNGKVKKIRQKSRIFCKSAYKESTNSSAQASNKSQEIQMSDTTTNYLESTPKRRTSATIGSCEFSRILSSPGNVQSEIKSDLGQSEVVEEHRRKKGKKCPEPIECLNTSTTSADLDTSVKSSNQPNLDSLTETESSRQHFKSSEIGLSLDGQVGSINGRNQKSGGSDSPRTFCPTTLLNKLEELPPSKVRKEEGASEIHTLSTVEPETHLESSAFEMDEIGLVVEAESTSVFKMRLDRWMKDEGVWEQGMQSSSLLSVEFSTIDSLSTSKLIEEEEEEDENDEEDDENLPSILLHQEQWSVAEGMLVWCKFQKYPYWPAVVRSVKSRIKKASILFVDENIIDAEKNKKGFYVSVRTLKPFDCEDRHQLTAGARYIYKTSIDWCVALIDDYRIRRGCGSFTGSFVEYCAAELSIPVRKSFGQDPSLMTFPYTSIAKQEEGHSDSESETTPARQQPTKKLLPDRKKAARDRANEKLVHFIVKSRGAEKHLQAVIKGQKHSRWLEEFKTRTRNSNVIDTYLEDDWQVDKVVNYLKTVCEMSVSTELLEDYERSRFILDVLLPEAIICAIAEVEQMSIRKAEEKYMKGPLHSGREVEHFNKEIEKEMKLKQQLLNEEESTD
ncbi:PWWP domain-containing DNA repair factor 3A-like isoform X2 [Heptranchias perlo]|uniref:PWWP domain-containing DNA repair factor 3A-like isoform X2 n=1 Tax=Heptranchias perlo TaxID=212740 RepID=UPI003559EB81